MRRILAILGTLFTLALLAVAGGAFWLHDGFNKPSGLETDTTLIVPRGTGVRGVADLLAEAGVVKDTKPFLIMLRVNGMDRRLKAGEYLLPAGASPKQAAEILVKGETVKRFFTIPEGLTSHQILARFAASDDLKGPVPDSLQEGSLLPETYQFSHGETVEGMMTRMRKAHDAALAELWPMRAKDLPIKTPEEAVILASIVERETAVAAERGKVAGVFINRLRKGMRLQSDPTTAYALTKGAPMTRALTRKDWRIKNPYNTYHIKGLPPGPICHPGRDSLAAVLNPMQTDALYFVADGSGGHAFAKTLKQHNRNVANWRKFKRENGL